MKSPRTAHIAWLLPAAYLLHLLEERYVGEGLPAWFSRLFSVELTVDEFIIINAIAFSLIVVFVLIYTLGSGSDVILLALVTLFFVNGWVHLVASLLTASYSPGTITGLAFYIPLGFLFYRDLLPRLSKQERRTGIVMGIVIHLLVTTTAILI